MSAEFKVIKVDPEGSGVDFSGHLGMTISNAKRCCHNCTVIFGKTPSGMEIGPFIIGELQPLNEEANSIQNEVLKEAGRT